MTDVVRGPCRVQAKGCRGKGRSCNNDHNGAWSWRKASKPGVLDADGPNKKDYVVSRHRGLQVVILKRSVSTSAKAVPAFAWRAVRRGI